MNEFPLNEFFLEDRIQYFGDPNQQQNGFSQKDPVNVMVLTSVRDVGTCDKNGSMVDTPEGRQHMEGIVERIIVETQESGRLHDILRLVGVITDDLERDMRRSEYSPYPDTEKQWIHNRDLRDVNGELVAGDDMTHWLPSDFRSLPLHDAEGRARHKEEFEQRVLELMQQRNADVLVSDHYMARIAYMIQDRYGKFGKVLNIHPAVTKQGDPYCFRGPTPTQDAIDRAKADGQAQTGATLHFVNEVIDDGPQIAYVSGTSVYPNDEPQHLRYRNYQQAKLPLFVSGVRHYIEKIYPHINALDLNNLSLLNHVSTRDSETGN